MSSKCLCTSSTLCSGCQNLMVEGLNHGPLSYVPGNCAKRLIQYLHQMHLNANGSIEFWRELVSEFFAPNAKRRWCFLLCRNRPKQTAPFAQRAWQCQVCKQKPGCGYEVTAEMLPALSTVSYDTGILKELLYVDIPSEHQNVSGEIVVHYDKATVELVYQNLRIVHNGTLCIVFTPDLKICSWDFCIRNIEQFISGNTLVPQVDRLRFLSCEYNHVAQNASAYESSELKRCSDELAEAAYKFQRALKLPPVTDVGFTRKYLRSIEMSEGCSLMGDLIDHSLATGMSPRMSLAILGGSSSQDEVPNTNTEWNRPLVQLEDNHNVAPNGDRTYACSSSRIPSYKSSEAAAETVGEVNFTRFSAASTTLSSWADSESSPEFRRPQNLPPVTDVGLRGRHLRSRQISEVLTLMVDLIDHSLTTGMSPRMSLAILGGSSSQDVVPNSNRKRNRPLPTGATRRQP